MAAENSKMVFNTTMPQKAFAAFIVKQAGDVIFYSLRDTPTSPSGGEFYGVLAAWLAGRLAWFKHVDWLKHFGSSKLPRAFGSSMLALAYWLKHIRSSILAHAFWLKQIGSNILAHTYWLNRIGPNK